MVAEIQNITTVETIRAPGDVSVKLPVANEKYEEKPPEKIAAQDKPLNSREIEDLIDETQNFLDEMNVSLKFSTYGKNDERTAITVTEKETGKLIREIPPEELQQLYMKMHELVGMLFNRTV